MVCGCSLGLRSAPIVFTSLADGPLLDTAMHYLEMTTKMVGDPHTREALKPSNTH